jgi:hypothetical protein
MFYICRFSDNWTIYDTTTNKSQPLQKEEVAVMQKLFGELLSDSNKLFSAVKVETISLNKLQSLPGNGGK